ncbi:MAG: transcription antitermination factor NusB [Atopobiaceae bacterium]|nr:transcription antitermination factor NusB [Atopobiaceae bacterium]
MSARSFGGRTLARSQALQLLFQAEALGRSVTEILSGPYALSKGPLDEYGERIALGADAMREELDAIISSSSTNWTIDRMPSVDRNLLRLAIYEMLEVDEVAVAVSIDESVELAKAYGTDESSRFVNGLLGKVASDLEGGVKVSCAVEAQDVGEDASGVPQEAGNAEDAAADASGSQGVEDAREAAEGESDGE